MNDNLNYSSEVRKGLISMLMFNLYSHEQTIYREYVQNALDSINAAVKLHILDQLKDGVVGIDIDYEGRRIVIRDNGKGIQSADAVRILLDISASNKDGITEAGQFGIGRLVGGGYCHEMVFTTSARGEEVATQIVFDIDKIWRMVKEDKKDYLATEVLNRGTTKRQIPAKAEEHFFEVQLNNVKEEYSSTLLNAETTIKYLEEVAPVDYKPQFVNILISGAKQNKKYEALHTGLEKIQLFVGNTPVRKQYGLKVAGTGDDIESLEYFTIQDDTFGKLAWGWFALTKYTIQISKDDPLAGIRLRAHNIQIGDASQLSGKPLWSEERGNSYFYGEIFVTHRDIRPNSARDGLVPTPATKAFLKRLELYFKELRNVYTKANAAKKAIEKIHDGVKLSKERGLDYYKAKDDIDNKGKGVFEKLLKNSEFPPVRRMLALYEPDYKDALNEVSALIADARSKSKDKTEPAPTPSDTITSPPAIIISDPGVKVEQKAASSKIGTSQKEAPQVADPLKVATGDMPTMPKEGTGKIEPKPVTQGELFPSSSPTPQGDIVASLNGILDKGEIWLIRKVFKVLNDNCPKNEHDQRLIEQLKMLIVKEFRNGK